jgi:hypothetical protein
MGFDEQYEIVKISDYLKRSKVMHFLFYCVITISYRLIAKIDFVKNSDNGFKW